MGKGPCEHMIALFFTSADGREDLPTSQPAATEATSSLIQKQAGESEAEASEGKEDFDERESDENNEAR